MTAIHPFDLQARAELAARSLTALLDPERDGLMYFLANWQTRPPRADHGLWDCGDGSGRHVDALTLARAMVREGSPAAAPDQGEEQLESWMLRLLGGDGLSWLPAEPWAEPWEPTMMLVDWQASDRIAEISWAQRGTLMGLLSRYLRTSDERYLSLARRLIDGLLRVAVRHTDGLFFPEGYYRDGGWRYHAPNLHACLEEYNAAVALPAIRMYEATGYEPALDLAAGLIGFALRHTKGYLPDGRFLPSRDNIESHFHTRSNFILSVLKLGLVLERREYVSWARQSYEHAKTWGTDFGWFPEGLGHRHGEICCTTDMIEIALLLGKRVDRRYYADAERFGRNHLLESQFLSQERLTQALERLPDDAVAAPWNGRYSTWENVARSQIGGFASRGTLNDAFHLDAARMMQCCNAAGTRALYDLWRYAVEESDQGKENRSHQALHLRFSVETPTLRIVSHEPALGQLDILAKRACEVAIRLPTGTAQALVVSEAAEAEAVATPRIAAQSACEGYIHRHMDTGEKVTVHYPLVERSVQYEVGSRDQSVHCAGYWRGETLMSVEPRGEYYPLYERALTPGPVQPGLPVSAPIASL